jgi:hypothetical protein
MDKQKKGQILAVKSGYNPNSSSIGSQIHMFLITSLSAGGTALAVLHIWNTVKMKINTIKSGKNNEKIRPGQEATNR